MTDMQLLLASPVQHRISWSPAKMRNVLRSPIKSHGGKFYLSEALLTVCAPAMAQCNEWHEHCAGGANTALQAPYRPGVIQIVADSDALTANVWRVFANEKLAVRLLERLQSVECDSREAMEGNWQAATMVCNAIDSDVRDSTLPNSLLAVIDNFEQWPDDWRVAVAAAVIVNSRMSRGGMGKSFAWQDRDRGGQPGEMNSWKTFVWNHAPRVVEKCRNWFSLCADALMLADPVTAPDGGHDNPAAFYYYDPPYVKETRSVKDVYREDQFDHRRFVELCYGAKARIAISGYANALYAEWLSKANGWTRHEFHIINHSGQGKKKAERIESLWTNF